MSPAIADLLLLIISLFGLWAGTEILLKGAIGISTYFRVSQFFVGLTVVALGTDLPELVIGIASSVKSLQGTETSGIIVGNVIGSSFSQISLILGLAGVYGYLTIPKRIIKWDGLMLIFSVILFFTVGYDNLIDQFEASILITLYLLYFYFLWRREYKPEAPLEPAKGKKLLFILYFLGGVSVIWFTSQMVTENALNLAQSWGLSQSLIGIVMIGLGTSLPELAVSLNAITKKATQISVGNIIGSNIFDLIFVIGSCAMISPLKVEQKILYTDTPLLLFLSVLVIAFFLRKKGLQKIEALTLINVYVLYIALKLLGQI